MTEQHGGKVGIIGGGWKGWSSWKGWNSWNCWIALDGLEIEGVGCRVTVSCVYYLPFGLSNVVRFL